MRVLGGIVLALAAGAAQAEVSCKFNTFCRSGAECVSEAMEMTVAPMLGGSSSRIVVNGLEIRSATMVFDWAMLPEGQGTVVAYPDGRAVYTVKQRSIVHVLTTGEEDGAQAVYTIQEADAGSADSYFGICEGRL